MVGPRPAPEVAARQGTRRLPDRPRAETLVAGRGLIAGPAARELPTPAPCRPSRVGR
ncbi:hypothetical protein BGLA2_60123 [Burkholderia gladioli]|nr:hypothetical protein BGLA2_60123 [Burkholderia gladioli]